MIEAYASFTIDTIDFTCCIFRITRCMRVDFFCLICNLSICIYIKQPKWDIYAFDFVHMVFFLEYLGKIFFTFQMLIIVFFGSFFIQFKWDDIIWFQITWKLTFHSYFIIAERTGRCSCCFLSYDLTSTGLAAVDAHAVQFIILPLTGAHWVPVIVWNWFSGRLCIFGFLRALKLFDRHFRIAVWTFHVLRFRIKYHRGITGWTLIFYYIRHIPYSSF